MGFLVPILYLGATWLPIWGRLRHLAPQRRLVWIAALSVFSHALLRLVAPNLNAAIVAGDGMGFHIHLAIVSAGLATALTLGLIWFVIEADIARRSQRIVAGILFWASLAGALFSPGWWAILTIPLAIRTGWVRRVAEGAPLLPTITSLIACIVVFAWPTLEVPLGARWSQWALAGLPIFRFAKIFLALQLGILFLRFLLGLFFGPRRIGRRLLASHLLAGVVPVALVALFATLIALLAIANYRAPVATDLLRMQHNLSSEILEKRMHLAIDAVAPAPGETWDEAHLRQLAGTISARWPKAARWTPGGSNPDQVVISYRTPTDTLIACHWAGDAQDPRMPAEEAWVKRPIDTVGCGIVRHGALTLHVTEAHWQADPSSWLRIQIIEFLRGGHVKILEENLSADAMIDEGFCYRGDQFIRTESEAAVMPGDEPIDSEDPSSFFNSGQVRHLLPAQEWIPHEAEAASRGARTLIEQSRWERIRIPVLATSGLADLIPSIPTIENPASFVSVVILIFVALLFVGVETFAVISALRMGRTIAGAVSDLRAGAERLQRGELSYRLQIAGTDELASLGESFNEMAAGLEEGRQTLLEKERLESELELARRIQERLLPQNPPAIPGLELAGISVPARLVGGDYYDFVPLGNDRLLVVMADVSGKGAPAALLMSSLRASLHGMIPGAENLAELASQLNRFVHASTDATEFITLFFCLIDPNSGGFSYVNAGHEPPCLIRSTQTIDRLTEGGLMMGAFAEAPYTEGYTRMEPGDLLFLYTDGLTEAHNPAAEMFGETRSLDCLRDVAALDPENVLRSTLAKVDAFVEGAEASDDITLVAVRRTS